MKILEDSVKINRSPETIFQWFTHFTGNYRTWHKDHVTSTLICSGGFFSIKPSNGGSIFTAALFFRFGGILSKVAKKRFEAIRLHMKEEGENLKSLLENESKLS